LFTNEFHPVFVNLLLAHWQNHNMHRTMSERELLQKAMDIADQGVLRRPDNTPWEMVSVVGGDNPTFRPDGNGNFIFTTRWNVHFDQQPSGQCQQIIAIDWNIPGGGVHSYVWFLEGIYAPGQEINLIFTEAMLRSISGYTFNANGGRGGSIVIKRIAYQENLDQVLLQQFQMLPTTFATIPTVLFTMEHPNLGSVELQFAEFTFSGFRTEFDNFPGPSGEEENDTDDVDNNDGGNEVDDKDNNVTEGNEGDRVDNDDSSDDYSRNVSRVSNDPVSTPPTSNDVPVNDVPVYDVPVDDVPINDVPVYDVPTNDVPVNDEPQPEMPKTGVDNSLTLFGLGLLISLTTFIILGLGIRRRYPKY